MIKIENLTKKFGELEVLKGVSLTVNKGEVISIVGPSGAGKTTLLKILNEILPADEGSFRLGTNVEIGYYDQEMAVLDMNKTIFDEISDDYPELPDVGEGRPIRIPQSAMKELIGSTIFAVSENQGRPIHTGVKFEVADDTVSAIAVDGFRLARRTYHCEEATGRNLSFVVPAQGLKEVEKILQDTEDFVAFTLGSKHILFQMGSATLICRLLEGDFLDWRRVVPTNCPLRLCANVSDLTASIERVGLIVSEKYKSPVRCVFGSHELLLKTSTTIGAAEDKCAIAGDGKELEIGFNVRYLADALRAVPSDEVTLELTNGLSPIVLTPVDDKHDFAYMVLPVRIKNG